MHDMVVEGAKFIDLNFVNVSFLFMVGFIGGLVSGFIGSGGAFVSDTCDDEFRRPRSGSSCKQYVP